MATDHRTISSRWRRSISWTVVVILVGIVAMLLLLGWTAPADAALYLPLILKPLPSPQESISIAPTDNNYYIVSWNAVTGATANILEEAADAAFSNPTDVYEGLALD